MVGRQQKRLQALEQVLQGMLYSIQFEGEIKWPIIFEIIHLFQPTANSITKVCSLSNVPINKSLSFKKGL